MVVDQQAGALLRKTFTVLARQKKTLCCQICFPIFIILFVGALQLISNDLTENRGAKQVSDTYPHALAQSSLVAWDGVPIPYVDNLPANQQANLGYLFQNGSKAGFIGNLPHTTSVNGSNIYASQVGSVGDLNGMLLSQMRLNQISNARNPVGGYIFQALDYVASQFAYTVQSYNTTNNGSPYGSTKMRARSLLVSFFSNAMMSVVTNSNYVIQSSVQAMPTVTYITAANVAEFLGTSIYPLVLFVPLPMLMFGMVQEKQQKLREMMRLMGMKMKYYWTFTYMFNFLIYLFTALMLVIISGAMQLRWITQTGGAILFLILFGWGLTICSFAVLLSSFIGKTITATVFGYIYVFFINSIAGFLEQSIFNNTTDYLAVELIAPFPLHRTLRFVLDNCAGMSCPTNSALTAGGGSPLVQGLVFIYVDALIYLLLGLYLVEVLPQDFGVPRHPLFFLHDLRDYLFKRERRSGVATVQTALLEKSRSEEEMSEEPRDNLLDSDVAAEYERVVGGNVDSGSLIVIKNLVKKYNSDKLAVNDLCLSMRDGECFGLLGPNGAGKTTTISILCGMFPPTKGTAFVNFFDVRTQMSQVHKSLGLCPQFDILWPDLSCEEHLMFYARLKGVPASRLKDHVEEIMRNVGLMDKRLTKAHELSGGMKRRLSIAISITGDPKIVLLDEPTTGLDPTTRRQLWDVITAAKVGKCLILTTHSLEEADVLCGRIGIMINGGLRCLGTPLHLKNKFGKGFRLQITYEPKDERRVLEFISRVTPGAHPIAVFQGNRTYEVPRDTIAISELFALMENEKSAYGIKDYSISQTSLEDVFLKLVREQES